MGMELGPRMRISARVRYACLALIDIAQSEMDGFPRRMREIAQRKGFRANTCPRSFFISRRRASFRALAVPGADINSR